MVTIIRKELQILFKERGTFLWLIAMPIAFIILFSSIYGSTGSSVITVNYLDEDHSAVSQAFISAINRTKGFQAVTDSNDSLSVQEQKIKNGTLDSLLVIPQGFSSLVQSGSQAQLVFYSTTTSSQTSSAIRTLLDNIADGYKTADIQSALSSLGATNIRIKEIMTDPFAVNNVSLDVHDISASTQVVPGMMVMFVFFILISMTRGFVKERESGMLARLSGTPMKPADYIAGMWVSFIITVLIQCAVILAFGYYVYKLHVGNLLAIAGIIAALSVCATGIGLALSFFVKSEQQGVALTQIIVMGGAALGGLWFPLEFLPSFAQKIAHVLPQYWAQVGLQNIMVRGANLSGVLVNILVLLAFGLSGLTIALLRFKRYLLSATN